MERKKKFYRALSAVSLVVALAAVISIGTIFVLYRRSLSEYQSLSQTVRSRPAESAAAAETAMPAQTPPESAPGEEAPPAEEAAAQPALPIPIDFAYLTGLNEDVIGWIEVEGTEIDFPILYDRSEKLFYLNHNHAKAYTPYGSIFMLSENNPDFRDFNTVVYGHNMLDGSMFAQLHRFEQQDFFDENSLILVYTPDRVLCYRVFAAYMADNRDQLLNFDYETPEGREAYIDQIYEHGTKAIFNDEITVTSEDRILTLSTCIGNPALRYLVQGVLISEDPGVPVQSAD